MTYRKQDHDCLRTTVIERTGFKLCYCILQIFFRFSYSRVGTGSASIDIFSANFLIFISKMIDVFKNLPHNGHCRACWQSKWTTCLLSESQPCNCTLIWQTATLWSYETELIMLSCLFHPHMSSFHTEFNDISLLNHRWGEVFCDPCFSGLLTCKAGYTRVLKEPSFQQATAIKGPQK